MGMEPIKYRLELEGWFDMPISLVSRAAKKRRDSIGINVIVLPSIGRSEIRGRAGIKWFDWDTRRWADPNSLVIQSMEPLVYKALVIELQGEITLSIANGKKVVHPLTQLSQKADSDLICNSNIFAGIGTMNGLKKGDVSQAKNLINPTSFNFKMQLAQISEELPSTLETPDISVTYFLVSYIRTEHNYKELNRRQIRLFRGHKLIYSENEICKISAELCTESAKLRLISPLKYYVLNEPVIFNMMVEADHRLVGGVQLQINLVQVVYEKGIQYLETVLDRKTYKFSKQSLTYPICGKLLEKKNKISNPTLFPEMISYDQEDVVTVKHFLKCMLIIAEDGSRHYLEEEIFIGTARTSCPAVDSASSSNTSFLSRMRSQSVSSLLSLFPPSYSNLSSRRGSLVSLETLPPHYDDIDVFQVNSNECRTCHNIVCNCPSAPQFDHILEES